MKRIAWYTTRAFHAGVLGGATDTWTERKRYYDRLPPGFDLLSELGKALGAKLE